VIVSACVILQQQRRSVVDSDENVDGPVVIEVTECHPSRRVRLGKCRTTGTRNILKFLSVTVKQKHRLAVFHLGRMFFDFVIGVPIG